MDVQAAPALINLRSAIDTAEVGKRNLEEQLKNLQEEYHQAKKLISTLRRSQVASELEMTEKLKKAKGEALEREMDRKPASTRLSAFSECYPPFASYFG
ncbi:unnamed protein product [Allacma fusca]|uniref:Uncharacterized protein n=1 Tax=Allacma fusca TaxID=39272 RepID=A0A8J2JWJ6_9HEXA|nr:unnamed protein product [Allacma fusca]